MLYADTLATLLSCSLLAGTCAIAIAVLPWTDDEVDRSSEAWALAWALFVRGKAISAILGRSAPRAFRRSAVPIGPSPNARPLIG